MPVNKCNAAGWKFFSLLFVLLLSGLLFPVFSCDFSFTEKDAPDETGKKDPETWETAQPLYPIYQDSFLLGNIISPSDVGTVRFNLLKRHFNTVTAENDMKPDALAPYTATGAYRFDAADKVVKAALDAGLKVHGHTLVWHQQSPAWLNSGAGMTKEKALANLNNHITEVAGHYKGKLISWDVVNEAMRDNLSVSDANGDWKDCLRKTDSPWNQSIGPEYIELAFKAARAADPDAKLYYNDYNLNDANKAKAVYNMVTDINNRYPNEGGRPLIDGIGMQSHHHIYTDPATVEASIVLFNKAKVEISITEMDILAAFAAWGTNPAVAWDDNAAQLQAKQYAAMFKIFKKHASKISRVTFWGIDDAKSWKASSYPVLFDKDYKPKPAFYAVVNPEKY